MSNRCNSTISTRFTSINPLDDISNTLMISSVINDGIPQPRIKAESKIIKLRESVFFA